MVALRAIQWIALALLLLVGRAHAAQQFDVFLQVIPSQGPGPAGDSADPVYSGWIDVLGFESGLTHSTTLTPGAPAAKTQFREFTLVKRADVSTGRLFKLLTTGQLISTVKMVIAVRGPIRTELWKMTATTCFFTKQTFNGGSGDSETQEHISFAAGKIEWAYTQISASGDALLELFANWSVIDNEGDSGSRPPTSTGGVDSDTDGIPNDWELFYGLDPHAKDSDSDLDGDGLTALEEYIAHTDPNRPDSTFKVTGLQPAGGGALTLTWQSVVGLKYRVLTAPSPEGPFTFLKNVTSAGAGTTSTTVPGGGAQLFYKVVTP